MGANGGRKTCNAHTSGVPINAPPFFSVGCVQCEAKKAAGKVTGNEPPLAHGWRHIRDTAPRIDWARRRARLDRERAGKLAAVREHLYLGRK